jgi:4-hydroxybutyryl-CoA dehydratase/vinylacetyl-CoA-Delta-isomerase
MMTSEQYEESLRKMNFKVYMMGEEIKNIVDNPVFRPSLNAIKKSYELARNEQYQELMTATSNLCGEKINRFCHIHQNTDDLLKKVKMLRLMGRQTASCFQRCAGLDAVNAVYSVTYDMDQKLGTEYHQRFVKWFKQFQLDDQVVAACVTDPKGDRSKTPGNQPDPDLFLRVVEKRQDGIVVRGAKVHITGALNSHWALVVPTMAMRPEDKDYAVGFVTPADAEGIVYIYGRQSCDTRKLEPGADIDLGNSEYGGQEALMVFDNVFVPWEHVIMCGETEFAGPLVERFAGYHRVSYGGCKVGVGDVLIGAAALAAEYNGTEKASHIKDKLIEMTHLNESMYSCGIAASAEGYQSPCGSYMVDLLIGNVCKQNVTRFPYEIARLAEDIAGGLMVTLPSEQDLKHPVAGEYMRKYFQATVSVENRMRILRLIENMTLGTTAVGYRTESMHGAGSPQAQRVVIARQGNVEGKKALAKAIAHIKD